MRMLKCHILTGDQCNYSQGLWLWVFGAKSSMTMVLNSRLRQAKKVQKRPNPRNLIGFNFSLIRLSFHNIISSSSIFMVRTHVLKCFLSRVEKLLSARLIRSAWKRLSRFLPNTKEVMHCILFLGPRGPLGAPSFACLSVPRQKSGSTVQLYICFTDPYNHTYSESSWHVLSTDAPWWQWQRHTQRQRQRQWQRRND